MVLPFYIVLGLFHLPTLPVVYASLLSSAIGFAACCLDFVRFCARHKTLKHLQNNISISLEDMPVPETPLERDYQVLLSTLFAEKQRSLAASEKSMRELEEYYTLWAHQVKLPIAAMQLQLQSGNGTQEDLQAEIFRIEEYVEMALQYLRLESPTTDYLLRSYRLDDIVRQSIRKYARLFIQKGITLHYEPIEQFAVTDEKWLLFVFEQILSNAIKYTQKGSVCVYWDNCAIVFEDTGSGISESDLPRVFSRGFTGYGGRADKHATGLAFIFASKF